LIFFRGNIEKKYKNERDFLAILRFATIERISREFLIVNP